jgi:hypothetical protein
MLKSNGPNSISKDALRDEDYPWLINCTTQEYLVNVGQNSHFNIPLTCGMIIDTWTNNRGEVCPTPMGGSDTMLKSNGPNSISKDALLDEDYPWPYKPITHSNYFQYEIIISNTHIRLEGAHHSSPLQNQI